MKKMTIENINEYYKKTFLAIITLAIFLLILILKNFYFHLYNISFENLTNIETLIANALINDEILFGSNINIDIKDNEFYITK